MNTRMVFARAVAGAAMLGLAGCASRPNIEEFAFVPCDGATTAEIARLAKVSGGTDDRVWNINKDRDRAAENAAVWYESTPIRFGTNMVCVAVAKLGRKGSPIQIADAVFRSQILCRHDAGHSIILQCAAAVVLANEIRDKAHGIEISAGIADLTSGNYSGVNDFIGAAYDAMTEAKTSGKNKTILARL